MTDIITAEGFGGVSSTEANEQANERAYNALANSPGPDMHGDPMEYLEAEIWKANNEGPSPEDVPISQKQRASIGRRLHDATEDYREALKAAGNDQSKVDPAIIREHALAEAAHAEWVVFEERALEHNEQNQAARALRESNSDDVLIRMIKESAQAKRRHFHSVFNRGEIVEHRPPVPIAADHFDVRTLKDGLNQGGIDKARGIQAAGMGGYSETPVVFAPEAFHDNITALISRPAFWHNLDGKATRQALMEAGGAYGQLARAAATTGTGAWAGKIYWAQFYGLMGGKTCWFSDDCAYQWELAATDKAPVGAVDAPPAGGWVGENGAITLDDMETEVRELDAYAYAVASDVSHKYLQNTWAMQLGYTARLMEMQTSKAAIDIGLQLTRGTGVANVSPGGILPVIGGVNRNKIENIVKASELRAQDLINAAYKLDYEFRRGGRGPDRAMFMANGDTWAKIDTESATNRYVNTEGQSWVEPMLTYPSTMPFVEEPHVNFYLRNYACVENPDFEDLAIGKFTGLAFGAFPRSLVVRRSTIYSAVVPVSVMIGGQTTLQQRYATWLYVDIGQMQDNSLRGGAGPVMVIQPNRS